MIAETELFSAVAGMSQDPPTGEELQGRISELEKVVELYHATEVENPDSQLLEGVLYTFQMSAGSVMSEEACQAYWEEYEDDQPFSVNMARMKIGALMHQNLGIDPELITKMVVFGPAELNIDESLEVIKAISRFENE